MASRQVYTCDDCEKEFKAAELAGLTATVEITPAGSWQTRTFEKSGDYCPACLKIKHELVENFFRLVLGIKSEQEDSRRDQGRI